MSSSRWRGLGLVKFVGHDGERFPLTTLGNEVGQLVRASVSPQQAGAVFNRVGILKRILTLFLLV